MDEEAVLKKRVHDWVRLTELSDSAERGFKAMSGDEVLEFVRLYRRASADLSLLSTQTSNAEVIDYLNAIVSRAYGLLYRVPPVPLRKALPAAVAIAARTFRRHSWAFALSFVLFFGSAFFTYGTMNARPDLREHFVPEALEPTFKQWKAGGFEKRASGENVAMTAFYAQNNPQIGVMTNALSVASFGTITGFILWNNGAVLGALANEMSSVGKLGFLLASVAPHGVSEVGGLLVTASGGFVIAWAVINPGRRRRSDAMKAAGKDALILMLTGLTMIVIAAPIEGFFSFNPTVPIWAKVAFALCAFAAWTAYFVGYGHVREPSTPDDSEPYSRVSKIESTNVGPP